MKFFNYFSGVTGLSSTNITMPWTNRHNSNSEVALSYFKLLDKGRRQEKKMNYLVGNVIGAQ